jgi:hypothetical protein
VNKLVLKVSFFFFTLYCYNNYFIILYLDFIAFINTVDDLNKTIEQIIIDNLETTNILNTIDKKSKKIPQNNEEIDC